MGFRVPSPQIGFKGFGELPMKLLTPQAPALRESVGRIEGVGLQDGYAGQRPAPFGVHFVPRVRLGSLPSKTLNLNPKTPKSPTPYVHPTNA